MTRYTHGVRLVPIALAFACSAHEGPPLSPPVARVADAGLADAPPAESSARGPRLPEAATPIAYDVELEVDPDREAFAGRVKIRVRLDAPADRIALHAIHLELARATFASAGRTGTLAKIAPASGRDVDTATVFGFGQTLPAGELTLAFDYTGHVGRDIEEALFRQQAGGRWFLYTQSEAMFARQVLPCFDEPRFKPAWRVTLVVPRGHVALANGAQVAETKLPDGRRRVVFAEIAAMPSYLFSIAVGPFALVDVGRVGRAQVPVRVAVAPADAKRVGVVAAKLPAVVGALERYLDRPLPLAKLDLVGVPRFFGAMENVGLVTIESDIIAGDGSRAMQRKFVRFSAHELAHQWFGNSATPAWWDDLWLSEGFATWLGEKVADELGAYDDPALRAQLARLHALAADDSHDPRPIRREVATAGEVEARFDAISYEKTGAVLEAMERFVGAAAFRDLVRAYLDAGAGRAVTTEDFLQALGAASPPARDALKRYLAHAGSPIVDLDVACGAPPAIPAIELRARTGVVPVCIRHASASAPVCTVVAAFHRIELAACPAWVIGNAGGAGYYRIANPLHARTAPLTAVERLAFADELGAGLVRGDVAIADALRELRALAAGDALAQLGALAVVEVIDPIVDDATRPAWSRWLASRFASRIAPKAVTSPRTAIDHELRGRLAAVIGDRHDAAHARAVVDRMLADRDLPPDYALAIAAPRAGKPLFDRIVALAAATAGSQREVLESLGAFGPELAPHVADLMLDPRFKPADAWRGAAAMLARPATRTAIWRAVVDRLPRIKPRFAVVELSPIVDATRSLCEPGAAAQLAGLFPEVAADRRARAAAVIDRCVARRGKLAGLSDALNHAP